MEWKTPVDERGIMSDSNQFGTTPEDNQQTPLPEQPAQTTDAGASTPQTPAYTPAPEYGAYAPAQPDQPAQPTPEYGQYAQSANNPNTQPATPQYGQYGQYTNQANTTANQQTGNPYIGGQYTGPTPTGAPYTQSQSAPYTSSANQYQSQCANPYGQAPQYGAPLPQGVPGYMPGDQSIGVVPLDQPDYRCTFGNAVKRFFTKYAVFSGRASRREFWWVILFFVLCSIALGIIGGMFAFISTAVPTILSVVWTLATIVPYVALAVRRVHDSNRSGWWVLLPGVPYVISQILNYAVVAPATDQITNTLMSVAAGADEDVATQIFIHQVENLMGPSAIITVCGLIYLISGLVLMCAAPNPAGARFDAARPDSPAPQAAGYNAPGYGSGAQTGNNPYTQSGNPFSPQNQ